MTNQSNAMELNEYNFQSEVLEQAGVVIVSLYTDWCSQCYKAGDVIDELSPIMQDVRFAKLNHDNYPLITETWGTTKFPTFRLYKDGVFLASYDGATNANAVKQWIRGAVA